MVESRASGWVGVGLAFGITLFLFFLLVILKRRRARRKPSSLLPSFPDASDESERERMIAWSIAVREALASRFGNIWKARTTEEIAADPELLAQLGAERSQRLLHFLREADRAKFADSSALLDHFDFEELAELVSNAVPAAGARSRISGA